MINTRVPATNLALAFKNPAAGGNRFSGDHGSSLHASWPLGQGSWASARSFNLLPVKSGHSPMTTENWKDIPGFEGRYQASDQGRVRNAKYHVLKPQAINSGYLIVQLMLDGKRKTLGVHVVVAATFIPGRFNKATVNHKNLVKTDNAATNLEWMTHSQNMFHAVANGKAVPPKNAVVGRAPDGREVRFDSQLAAEVALAGRASSAIHHCFIGKKKSAYGYVWSRA